jgi:O-antigen/teichoic acid export membrane protein
MAVGLGIVAEPLAAVFLDESMGWQGVAPYLAVLSLLSIPYPLCGVIFAYMQSYNRSWAWSAIEWVGVALLLGSMFLLGQIGPLWAASAAVLGFAARYVLFLLWLKHKDGTKVGPLVVSLGPPMVASAIMVAAVLGARALLDRVGLRSDLLQLIVEIVVGALVYPPVAFLLAPVASRDLLGLAGRVLRRRRKAQPNVEPETDEAA